MSEIDPKLVEEGVEQAGVLAATFGVLLAVIATWWKRTLGRLGYVERNMVTIDEHNRQVDKLEDGMKGIEKTFKGEHKITHEKIDCNHKSTNEKIDNNQKEVMAILLDLVKSNNSGKSE